MRRVADRVAPRSAEASLTCAIKSLSSIISACRVTSRVAATHSLTRSQVTRRLTTRESNHRDRPSRPRPVPSRMRACPEPECAPGRPAGQYPTRGRHRPTARLNPIISIAKSQKEVRWRPREGQLCRSGAALSPPSALIIDRFAFRSASIFNSSGLHHSRDS